MTHLNASLQFCRKMMVEGVKSELARHSWTPVEAVPGYVLENLERHVLVRARRMRKRKVASGR